MQLRSAADAMRDVSRASLGALDSGVAGAAERLAALTAGLEESRSRLTAIESESEDVGFKAASTLIEAIRSEEHTYELQPPLRTPSPAPPPTQPPPTHPPPP